MCFPYVRDILFKCNSKQKENLKATQTNDNKYKFIKLLLIFGLRFVSLNMYQGSLNNHTP